MSEVILDQVRKVYAGGVEAVTGIDIKVPTGAFCVLSDRPAAASRRFCG